MLLKASQIRLLFKAQSQAHWDRIVTCIEAESNGLPEDWQQRVIWSGLKNRLQRRWGVIHPQIRYVQNVHSRTPSPDHGKRKNRRPEHVQCVDVPTD